MRKLILALTLLSAASLGFAQTPTGTLQGTVQDPQGAMISGAKVSVISTTTGGTKTATTDTAGRFSIPYLNPGTYTVIVEARGFRTARQDNVVAEVSQTNSLTFNLGVGQATETVEVSVTSGNIDTQTSSLDTVVHSRTITDIPLNGRNPFDLATLVPAVSNIGNASTPHIGGSRNANNEQQIDGMTNILPENNVGNNTTAYQPIVDSVQEFSVQTSVLPAEYGRFSGGTISLITKSGGEQFHGSAFEFARNAVLDSNDFGASAKPDKHRYQTGGTIGGPILLDRSKHSFFFFAYENSQENNSATEFDNVPDPTLFSGDFSSLIPAGTDCNVTRVAGCIFDPLTGHDDGSGNWVRSAFPGNVIPQERLSSVGLAVAGYYPTPNATPSSGNGNNNYVVTGSTVSTYSHWDTRLDHDFGAKWHSFLRVSHWDQHSSPLDDFKNAASQGWDGPAHTSEWSAALNNTFTFSPTLLGELRYGISRFAIKRSTFGQPFDLGSLGFNDSYVSTAAMDGLVFPRFDMSNGYAGLGPNGWNSFSENPLAHSFTGSIVKIAGSHSVKVGAEFRKLFLNFYQYGRPSGYYSVDQSWTQDTAGSSDGTGNPIASLLLGLPNYGNMTHDPSAADASAYVAVYGQDDWKVRRNLTLNIGLRWDVEIPRTERFNQLSYWDPDLPSPLQGLVPADACAECGDLRGQMLFVNSPGSRYGRHQAPTQWKDFGPRFGFAYDAGHSLAVRGGFGIVFAPSALQAAGTSGSPGIQGFASQTNFNTSFDNQHTIATTLDNPAPQGFNLPTGTSLGAATSIGSGIDQSYFDSYRNPYSEQWNLNVQKGLPGKSTVEVGYLGNHGLFLINGDPGVPYSQLPTADLALGNQLTQSVPNPFYGIITTPGSPLSQQFIQYNRLLRPFPQYDGVSSFRKPGAQSIYHGFTAKFDKRFSHGLTLLASYTAAKLIDNSASAVNYLGPASQTFADQYQPGLERSISAQDVSHMLVVSYTYELPFGRGRTFLGNSNGFVNAILGGWQTTGLVNWTSGTPIVLAAANNQTNIFTFSQRPDWNGQDAKLSNQTPQHWFNTDAFSQPAPFTIGNAPRTLPDVRTPGVANTDLSFFKNNRFGADGRFNAQFRVEMFNAFNHARLNAPDANVNDGSRFGTISGYANAARQIQLALKFIF